jgi:mannosyltransferase
VHDFTYEYYSSGLARTIHIWQKGLAIKKSEGIICVSENTKNDLVQFYPSVDESKIKVIYNGIGNDFFRMDDALVFLSGRFNPLDAGKYILFVGDRSKYKNFNVVLDVMSELQGYQLVMIGGSELNENEKAKIVRERIDHFHFRGIPSEDLNIIYNNAFCLLYPSLYEGFGIPVVESMKAGCPVICSNLSSLPEVAGHAALLVSGVSVEEIVNAIHKLERLEFRESVISKGLEQAERFSWDKCFRETYQFYVDVWDKKYI